MKRTKNLEAAVEQIQISESLSPKRSNQSQLLNKGAEASPSKASNLLDIAHQISVKTN
jgi:hypothetical protein